jgi:hypothetical protein
MQSRKFWMVACGLLVSSSAYCAEFSNGEVERIYPAEDGTIYFRLKNDACNISPSYYYFTNDRASAKNWYAILLLATGAGRKVNVAVPACSAGNKSINYLLIEDLS